MPKKFKATWKAGSEYLPPFTIEESVNTLLVADKMFGEGNMSYDEATQLVIRFRETNGEMYTNMVRDEIDRQIIENIKNTIGEPIKGT
jgi:hypothetical protein